MEKEFVPYELAVKLKELGLDEECLARYCVVTEWEKPTGEIKLQLFLDASIEDKNLIKAPLWEKAFLFLLKKHYLYSVIIPTITMCWTFKTTTVVDGEIEVPPYKNVDATDYNTYEEAREACLKKLIQILEEKK